ncbi:MAG: hypothetical protein Q8L52_00685 [bacterium]|nr:hypothetical protein [bacterium]
MSQEKTWDFFYVFKLCSLVDMVNERVEIDEKIKGLVGALNRVGFPTTGSCQGHEDYRAPAFWIKIGAEDLDGSLRIKMERLLTEFYENRLVEPDVKIETENANYGFYIHNGGEAYKVWREGVNEIATKIANKEETKERFINQEEKETRLTRLPIYQKEAEDFANFLNNKLVI